MLFLPPPNAKILIVGEAPGEQEEMTGLPFMGHAGQMLTQELKAAGIDRADCALTNVFDIRPKDNNLAAFNVPRSEWLALSAEFPLARKRKNMGKDLWPRPELVEASLKRLANEIALVKPNLILALGNTALWALTGSLGITKLRGTITFGDLAPDVKILPTFHPASIFRQWSNRPILAADLQKAQRESASASLNRTKRLLWLRPTCEDLRVFEKQHIAKHDGPLSVDVETPTNTVACIGLSRHPSEALVLPFLDRTRSDWNYWRTFSEERFAYLWLKRILEDFTIPKLFQNGLFDIQHFFRMGIRVRAATEDTMLMHHSMYSSMNKGLGFLGSIYVDEIAWKLLRPRHNNVEKKDE